MGFSFFIFPRKTNQLTMNYGFPIDFPWFSQGFPVATRRYGDVAAPGQAVEGAGTTGHGHQGRGGDAAPKPGTPGMLVGNP